MPGAFSDEDFMDKVLCRFCSRTVGNWADVEDTDGLVRRPRAPLGSLLSVDDVELLADDECLRSPAEPLGDSLRVSTWWISSPIGSQAGSFLNVGSILVASDQYERPALQQHTHTKNGRNHENSTLMRETESEESGKDWWKTA